MAIVRMSENNKPEIVADTVDANVPSEGKAFRDRIAEGIQQQKDGDVMNNNAPTDAKETEGTADVNTQGSSPQDNSVDVNVETLKFIETSTGRKFENVEDAKQYLTNLNKLVGDQALAKGRDALKVLSSLETKFGKPTVELEQYFADLVLNQTNTVEKEPTETEKETVKPVEPKETEKVVAPATDDKEKDGLSKRLESLEYADGLRALTDKYPEAAEVSGEIALIAQSKDISFVEAYEKSPLKNLVDTKVKEEESKSPVVTSSNRTNIDYDKAQKLGEKALSGQASKGELEDLVGMVLDIK